MVLGVVPPAEGLFSHAPGRRRNPCPTGAGWRPLGDVVVGEDEQAIAHDSETAPSGPAQPAERPRPAQRLSRSTRQPSAELEAFGNRMPWSARRSAGPPPSPFPGRASAHRNEAAGPGHEEIAFPQVGEEPGVRRPGLTGSRGRSIAAAVVTITLKASAYR